jgi:hypothetical protein
MCSIPCIFFALYSNKLTDDDRFKKIEDTKHYVSHISYIHIQGIKDVDVKVTLKQNINVKLSKLLLSLHAETTNGCIFYQMERQKDENYITYIFHTTDAELVAAKLPMIASLISNYIKKEDVEKVLINPDHSLHCNVS